MKTHTTRRPRDHREGHPGCGTEIPAICTRPRTCPSYHHEKWDGQGYPSGLAGEDIPLSARIMAVADVFDALVSRRSYKEPFPFEKAMAIIREGAGTQFDPLIVQAFADASDEVRKVSEGFHADPVVS